MNVFFHLYAGLALFSDLVHLQYVYLNFTGFPHWFEIMYPFILNILTRVGLGEHAMLVFLPLTVVVGSIGVYAENKYRKNHPLPPSRPSTIDQRAEREVQVVMQILQPEKD